MKELYVPSWFYNAKNESLQELSLVPLLSTEIAVLEFVASCMVFTLSIDAITYPISIIVIDVDFVANYCLLSCPAL